MKTKRMSIYDELEFWCTQVYRKWDDMFLKDEESDNPFLTRFKYFKENRNEILGEYECGLSEKYQSESELFDDLMNKEWNHNSMDEFRFKMMCYKEICEYNETTWVLKKVMKILVEIEKQN